jgi:hypothetical protein
MPEASIDDVRVEIDTTLSDGDISDVLDRVARDIDREYDAPGFDDTQHRQDFEAVLAALRIASGRDRRAEEVTSGRTSQTYETSEVKELRNRVRRLDPGDVFGRPSSTIRDSGRHVSTTGDE